VLVVARFAGPAVRFSGVPYALIQRLLSKNKSEVLVTVMVDSIDRWLEHPDENIKAHIAETFGTHEAIKIDEGTVLDGPLLCRRRAGQRQKDNDDRYERRQ
jgi:hypothetical protein